MKKTENFLLTLIVIFLSIHLFVVHSKLLFHLNPDKISEYFEYSFSFELFTKNMLVSTLSAIAYSFITAFILFIFVKYKKVFLLSVISFSLLDGLGVFIYYNTTIQKDLFMKLGSLYYSLYTLFIIFSVGLYRNKVYSDEEIPGLNEAIKENDIMQMRDTLKEVEYSVNEKSKRVKELKKEGLTQKEIAEELNISQSMVSRILNK